MLLKDFIDQLTSICNEAKGTHHFGGKVEVDFYLDDPSDELGLDIELVPDDPGGCDGPVRPWILVGCGCWAGAQVHLQFKRSKM